MHIALIGHACSPALGSEPGLTWNWAKYLSFKHRVSVFTHPQYRQDIDAELQRLESDSLRVVYVDVQNPLDPWRPRRGERGIRIHYSLWQKRVVKVVRRQHTVDPFDLVHHVSWGSLQQPPPLVKYALPCVWGPIGGGQTWPNTFLGYDGGLSLRERIRSFIVRAAPWNPSIISAVRHADMIITTNRETLGVVEQMSARRAKLMFDNGIEPDFLNHDTAKSSTTEDHCLTLFWGGRCEPRKGLPLLLEAIKLVKSPVQLVVAGDGPLLRRWQAQATKLGLCDRVRFLGRVSRAAVLDWFSKVDAFVFTSLRDAFGSIVLEAMAKAVPIIALDHQGVGLLSVDAAIKVPVTSPGEAIAGFAAGIEKLAAQPNLRRRMAAAALDLASQQSWDRKAQTMSDWYQEVIDAHRRH